MDLLTYLYKGTLVDRCVLVSAPVFLESIAVVLRQLGQWLLTATRYDLSSVNNDFVSCNVRYSTGPVCRYNRTGVRSNLCFETCTHKRCVRVEEWHGLPLHV